MRCLVPAEDRGASSREGKGASGHCQALLLACKFSQALSRDLANWVTVAPQAPLLVSH